MAKLESRSGTVRRVERLPTAWRGQHGTPITALDVGGLAVRYGGLPSVGVGDVVTVVGYRRGGGLWAQALRNESTDVSYVPRPWSFVALAGVLLGVVVPWLGFPLALVALPAGALALVGGLHGFRVRWLLAAQPSRHAAPIRAPLRATGHAQRR